VVYRKPELERLGSLRELTLIGPQHPNYGQEVLSPYHRIAVPMPVLFPTTS